MTHGTLSSRRILPALCLTLGLAPLAACDDDPGFTSGLGGDGDADGDGDVDDCSVLDANYQQEWAVFEQQVLDMVNQRRSEGANCGSQGSFGPTSPLTMQDQLRASARRHSWHMGEEGYFDHASPGGPCGDTPWDRIESAGYSGYSTLGENIAAGYHSAEQVMAGWMSSDGHCANIMQPSFKEIGVGYASVPGSEYTVYWTQNFGARPGQ